MNPVPPSPAPADVERVGQLGQLADLVVRVARRLEAHRFQDPGITPLSALESLLLRHIDDHPGISPTRIATDLLMKGSNVSAGLRSLGAKGLVTRAPDPGDARVARLLVTATARESTIRVRAEWGRLLAAEVPADSDIPGVIRLLTALDAPPTLPETDRTIGA